MINLFKNAVKTILVASLIALPTVINQSIAQDKFNFYDRTCSTIAENGCKAPLINGPCTKLVQGACKEFEKIKDCHWVAAVFGIPGFLSCKIKDGACKAHNQVCTEYQRVCAAGYNEICKEVLRPMHLIKDELAWSIYQEYMRGLPAVGTGTIHPTTIKELQSHYKTNLSEITISTGEANGAAITDCKHIRLPYGDLVGQIKSGVPIRDSNQLKLFLHELRHSDQCETLGSRKKYATMWFSQLEITTKLRVDEMIRDTIAALHKKDIRHIHDAMPMEADAESYAGKIMPEVLSKTRHGK